MSTYWLINKGGLHAFSAQMGQQAGWGSHTLVPQWRDAGANPWRGIVRLSYSRSLSSNMLAPGLVMDVRKLLRTLYDGRPASEPNKRMTLRLVSVALGRDTCGVFHRISDPSPQLHLGAGASGRLSYWIGGKTIYYYNALLVVGTAYAIRFLISGGWPDNWAAGCWATAGPRSCAIII